MQVEPVVTTSPEVYEDFLKDNFSLFIEKYASSIKSESVQTYADRLNPYGSYIKSQTDSPPVWVGCPLIVHRRCINPMFINFVNRKLFQQMRIYKTFAQANT